MVKRKVSKMPQRVPVSVATPKEAALRKHRGAGLTPLQLAAKQYTLTAKDVEAEEARLRAPEEEVAGCTVTLRHPLSRWADARADLVRRQLREGTLPRLKRPPPEDEAALEAVIGRLHRMAAAATEGRLSITAKLLPRAPGELRRPGKRPERHELLVWAGDPETAECIGAGVGKMRNALYAALGAAVAGLARKARLPKRRNVVYV
eukprot:TRINITY_DN16981_c3_g1_i1.p3 TRINITY_DN16981_c3_g1~~TRINITY_DN16981_c3_g1_i1.p3  ORF type:complete len:205 (+),score=51.13 TRINITY_DN16981_c3_g1_i1:78-692(+)